MLSLLRCTAVVTVIHIACCAVADEASDGRRLLGETLDLYRQEVEKLKEEMLRTKTEEYVAQNFVHDAPLERLSDFGPRFIDVAERFPGGEIAWAALRHVAYVRGFDDKDKEKAMRLLASDHRSRREFIDDLYYHHYRPGLDENRFYRIVLDDPDMPREIVGLTKFSLAVGLSGMLTDAEYISPKDVAEAKSLLRSVQRDYANLPHPVAKDTRNLGEAAADLEYRLTHLIVGSVAPELVGRDVHGKEIRLREYKGRIVLLVFCGDWCAPCRAMYPYEKKMLEDYADEQFAILGINSDSKEVLEESLEREQFPWTWIWDEGSTSGPIARKWGIRRWPSFVLLDRDQVIRKKKFVGRTAPERAAAIRVEVERLLREQE